VETDAARAPDRPAGPAGRLALPASILGMAAWGGFAAARAGAPPQAVSAVVVAAILLAISLVDFRVRRIPDALVLALLGWAIVQIAWTGTPTWKSAALGVLVGGGVFLLLMLLTRGTMGAGDVKLMAAGGALVGYPLIFQAILLGVVAGGVAALVLLLARRVRRKDYIAYGPYLALGVLLIAAKLLGLWR
jgi:prepilin signal peptidase PulO-like enzyme (type II secretory pathway)